MRYHVSLEELKNAIGCANIDNLRDDVSGRVLIGLKNPIKVGEGYQSGSVFQMIINKDTNNEIQSVCLYMAMSPNESQAVWTHILNNGFLDLALFPIMIDEDQMPTRLYLAPLRY